MMKSPLSFALSDKLEKTKASLEYLSSEIEQLNDPGSFLALHGHIREILEKSVISEHFDSESIGDEISAIRAAISLSIVDEYDREMDSVSSSLIKIKAASGLAIANLDVLLLILSKFGVRPRDVNFSSVLGQYVSSRGISTSLIEINERLNSIDELLATAVMDEAKKDVTATKIQWRMFSHFTENTARKIAVAKSNIDTGELVDVVALLRIVEQILRSAKGFFEGARQMVKSVTSSARDVAAKIWNLRNVCRIVPHPRNMGKRVRVTETGDGERGSVPPSQLPRTSVVSTQKRKGSSVPTASAKSERAAVPLTVVESISTSTAGFRP